MPRPKLKDIDDLFSVSSDMQNTAVAIADLVPFENHPFKLYDGERLEDMVESIKANGVLVPIIVRNTEDAFVILAGHNRVNAAKLAGLESVPAMVVEDISDEEAMVYVIETNLIQRSFSDMPHSEKAAVIALHHSKLFSQGKRNDIIERLKRLETPSEYEEAETSSQVANKLTSIAKVGESYSLSKDTVARYLRINKLIHALKSRLDENELAFIPAVTLSFLNEYEQEMVDDCMERNSLTVDMKKAGMLRQLSEEQGLTGESVYKVLSGEATPKPSRHQTIKVKSDVYTKYFTPEQNAKEVQDIVEKALEMYFDGSEEDRNA